MVENRGLVDGRVRKKVEDGGSGDKCEQGHDGTPKSKR